MKLFKWYRKNILGITEPRRFGWIPQTVDTRDRKLKLSVRGIPKFIDLRPNDVPMYDQGNLGSCTANAIGSLYSFVHKKQNLGRITPSRLFIYYNEREIEGTINEDAGAMIRDGMKSIGAGDKGVGLCSEWRWPYIISRFTTKPCKKCYEVAVKDQALQYMTLEQVPSQLKACIADGYPFVFGFAVYSSFMDIEPDGIMKMPQYNDNLEGGHAVKCVGYDDIRKVYIIKNSWGSSWGNKGYFYMPYDYMHDKTLCDDFWTIRLAK
jgi:C1A family cysteine protease